MEITFVVPCRPFTGIFDTIQRRALTSWREAVPSARIVLLGQDLPADTGADELRTPATNARGITTLSGVWEIACAQKSEWVCVGESDLLFDATLPAALMALAQIERPFVIGQRWDMNADGHCKLHPPSAVSYCIFRGGQLDAAGIPPFAIGRTLHDNWLVWAAMHRWDMTVIDATDSIKIVHINHPYAEHGDKEGMFRSAERAENVQLARMSGMMRPLGVNDAPWVLGANYVLKMREA